MKHMEDIVSALKQLHNRQQDEYVSGARSIMENYNIDIYQLLNGTARYVAREYLDGRFSFEDSIWVTTLLFWVCVHHFEYLNSSDKQRVEDMWSVFLIFDAFPSEKTRELGQEYDERIARSKLEGLVSSWDDV